MKKIIIACDSYKGCLSSREVNDVNGYCKYMYLIDDKEYIRKLVEEGQKPIVTGCDVVRYMKLAEEYWMIKYNKINEMM